MDRSRRRGAWVVPALAVLLALGIAGPAYASCAEPVTVPQALTEAQTVFVGTVVGLEHEDRVASFQVEEVWKGNVGSTVKVSGGPRPSELEDAAVGGSMVATSNDRTYVAGERYLVVSSMNEGEALLDTICSATQVYDSELDQYRPDSASVQTIARPTASGSSYWGWSVLGAATIGWLLVSTPRVIRRVRRRRSAQALIT